MITMYTRDQCQYCGMAKQWLQSRNINYREVNIDQDPEARSVMIARGHRSVPQFYVQDQLLVADGWSGLSRLSTEEVIQRISQLTNPTNLGTL